MILFSNGKVDNVDISWAFWKLYEIHKPMYLKFNFNKNEMNCINRRCRCQDATEESTVLETDVFRYHQQNTVWWRLGCSRRGGKSHQYTLNCNYSPLFKSISIQFHFNLFSLRFHSILSIVYINFYSVGLHLFSI